MSSDPGPIPDFLDRNKAKVIDVAPQAEAPTQTGHAKLSPSSAERWMACPGSLALSIGQPNIDSEYAQDGTDAHQLAAWCLLGHIDAWEMVGEKMMRGDKANTHFIATQDHADAVQTYLTTIRDDMKSLKDDIERQNNMKVEVRFDIREVIPECWGTADCVVYFPDQRLLRVYDFKYGAGIPVEAEENPQLKIYGAGAVHQLSGMWPDIGAIELVIVQPRCFHPDGPVRRWTIKTDSLGEWALGPAAKAAARAIEEVKLPEGQGRTLMTGDHCRFCPAKLVCPALTAGVDEALEIVSKPSAEVEATVKTMETFELAARREKLQSLRIYIKAIEDEAFRRMMQGESVPGAKLVNKKSDRVWKEGAEEAIKKEMGDRAYNPPALKSPAQLEKERGGKALAAEWAFKPDTGVTIADADDKRAAVKIKSPAEVFANVGKA